MCKLSNLYILDLWDNDSSGSITFNVANSLPQLMNQPCKIKVKQIQSKLYDAGVAAAAGPPVVVEIPPSSIDKYLYLRVVHNMNIQSGSNKAGFSNSNILSLFDTYKGRQTFATGAVTAIPTVSNAITGTTETNCTLFAPIGLPAILTLQRWGTDNTTLVDAQHDSVRLSWIVRLEITVNPDQE